MELDSAIKDILKDVALKYNVSPNVTEKIWMKIFENIKINMVQGKKNKLETFKKMQLPVFGKMVVRPKMLAYYRNKTIRNARTKRRKELCTLIAKQSQPSSEETALYHLDASEVRHGAIINTNKQDNNNKTTE